MGREVRRVPPNWQHPKSDDGNGHKPLYPGSWYFSRREEWLASLADVGLEDTLEEYGNPPRREDYMPDWDESEATHYMMYEDTTEGTPISPAFATPEELARWLTDNNASAFGDRTASYEGWLRVAKGGWAPGLVLRRSGLVSGVEASTDGGGE